MGTSCVEVAWVWIGIGEGSMAWPTGMEMGRVFNERRRRPGSQHTMQTQLFSSTGAHAYIFTRSTSSLESLSCCAKKKPVSVHLFHQRCSVPGVKKLSMYTRAYISSRVGYCSYARRNRGADISRAPHRAVLLLQRHRRPMGRAVGSFSLVPRGTPSTTNAQPGYPFRDS